MTFERAAINRLKILEEERWGGLTTNLLHFLQFNAQYQDILEQESGVSELEPLSNPDMLFVAGNRLIVAEMKATRKALGYALEGSQLTNIPHNVHFLLNTLRESGALQSALGLEKEERVQLEELRYDPTDPYSHWIVIGRRSNSEFLNWVINEEGVLSCGNYNSSVPRAFPGDSRWIPVTLYKKKGEDRTHAPIFHLPETDLVEL